MRRPILFPAFFYIYGIVLSYQFEYISSSTVHIILAVALSLSALLLTYRYFNFKLRKFLILILCMVAGSINTTVFSLGESQDYLDNIGKTHNYIMQVNDAIQSNGNIKLDCICLKIDQELVQDNAGIRVSVYDKKQNVNDLYGGVIQVSGKLSKPKSNTNPHCFNYRTYLKSIGIDYTLSSNSCKIITNGEGIKKTLLVAKESYLKFLEEKYKGEETPNMIRGMVFGDKSKLDDEVYDSFRHNGTAHVLAVSGLHVGLIFTALRKIFRKRSRKMYYILTALALIGYGMITQWSISVVRAILMIGIFLFGEIFHRRYDMLSSAVFVALLLLIYNPFQLFNCGFQMSFLAVVGICFLNSRFGRIMPSYFALICSVQVILIPYMAYQFNYISLIGFIINFPTTFLVSIIVPAVLIMFLLFAIFGLELNWIHDCVMWLTELLIKCNTITDSTGIGSFDVTSPKMFVVLISIVFVLYFGSEYFRIDRLRRNFRRIIASCLVLCMVSFIASYDIDDVFQRADMIFVDVGQGDCVNLRTDAGNYIFDGGGKVDYNLGEKVLKPYLLKNDQSILNGAFITHNHTDHFLGACQLSQSYNINTFYFSRNYESIKSKLEQSAIGKNYQYLDSDNIVQLDDETKVEILWPKAGDTNIDVEDENKNSMVMKIIKNGLRVLITGDIDEQCEKNLIDNYKGTDKLKCDILKVAHHGSKYSSSEAFLREASPKTAIIQVGINTYGHPSEETLSRLKENGIDVYRLDQSGAIGIVQQEEGGYQILSCLQGE